MKTSTAHDLANCFYSETKEALEKLKTFYLDKAEKATDQLIKQFWNTKAFACNIALSTKKDK